MRAVSRRDFLLFRPVDGRSTAEVFCQRLHMACAELEATAPQDRTADPTFDPSRGEPKTEYAVRTLDQLFDGIERDVSVANVLRVIDAAWLTPEPLRQRFEALVARFRAGGGTVEWRTTAVGDVDL